MNLQWESICLFLAHYGNLKVSYIAGEVAQWVNWLLYKHVNVSSGTQRQVMKKQTVMVTTCLNPQY